MSELQKLAAECEAAEGPDKALDAAIHCATHPAYRAYFAEGDEYLPSQWMVHEGGNHFSPPDYTASLDAALALVPQGLEWGVSSEMGMGTAAVGTTDRAAATPALALCAAALRARSCDSGRLPKGEDALAAECEASQSGGDSRIARTGSPND